ncbi:hypothetical protein J4406_00440 [Candidatus Woesearchaeota archaeon]|nr:hypothetical protein [Candidatus Woesearchaeota archaeon]
MVNLENQQRLFEDIGKRLKKRTECFVIGGSAMLYYGAKAVTKDIDVVFDDKECFDNFLKILKEIEFKVKDPEALYFGKENKPALMERGSERVDIFYKEIITFKLSESMVGRIKMVYEYNNLIANVVSPEDIILLKSATERAGDRADALELIKRFNVNWSIITKEAINQTELDKPLFVVFLYEFLLELKEDFKADIPDEVLKSLLKMSEKEMVKRLKKKGGFVK